ncbi:hypothetical protein HOLleu_39214 [Holothuria leucospilota]|uniref:Uncharacterized protein n=1 Tax=Holothuria leucospilota TaxID=206669 RepID=A0A9Q1BE72_HOLLE|nr:hypothetical protein HOLleu_39214 [Holothuria leucospilota]
MPVTEGKIGKTHVSVLRDSGCSTVVVRKSLVLTEQLTGDTKRCILLDGSVRIIPVAVIEVDTPFSTGKEEALSMENPLYDLVLGNIVGVRNPDSPDDSWVPKRPHELQKEVTQVASENAENTVNAVETRGQREKKAIIYPLHTPGGINLTATKAEVIQEQNNDPSLSRIRKAAEIGDVRKTGKGNETRFIQHKGLIYREFKSPKVEHGRVV